MKYLLLILSMSILLSGELEVDGNLKVTGTIQNDSLAQVISNLQAQITALQTQLANMECINNGVIPQGYCDCFGNIVDICGICGGDALSEDECNYIFDIDGNYYESVELGSQLWLAENLRVTRYQNGDTIPEIVENDEWLSTSSGAYSTIYDNQGTHTHIYGLLYNWYAADDERGLCMEGWHVPSNEEWVELEMFLGMSEEEANSNGGQGTDEGSKLAGNSDLWNDGVLENNPEFDTSGFAAVPAGLRYGDGSGEYTERNGVFYGWTSTEGSNNNSKPLGEIHYNYAGINYSVGRRKTYGLSIRCIKD